MGFYFRDKRAWRAINQRISIIDPFYWNVAFHVPRLADPISDQVCSTRQRQKCLDPKISSQKKRGKREKNRTRIPKKNTETPQLDKREREEDCGGLSGDKSGWFIANWYILPTRVKYSIFGWGGTKRSISRTSRVNKQVENANLRSGKSATS